ncbi:MAG TPA: toll/interleukin-1 receptor domain-containing protein [bacterium]|nr:toll/interleukin-1 receptor domain-containing protein [bacterium]
MFPLPPARLADTQFEHHALVQNAIGEVFGEVLQLGRGRIWLLPQSLNNAELLGVLVNRRDALQAIPIETAGAGASAAPVSAVPNAAGQLERRDVFLSYASEDRAAAQELADLLRARKVSVWFDEYELRLGDSLSGKIDQGLRMSRHGVVLLSHRFFAKNWPQKELAGLRALEKRILPVWHGLDADAVRGYSPTMADIKATSTEKGLDAVTDAIVQALEHDPAA